ncbi:MAG: hypothetical protein JRH06_04235 [Deltaproteobacteria bacterium]|nr:hypothetical protein [Deltaproteobacteria bacterium]MBW2136748.1 hypothetical protein [Deltaproteobacteria bacterium]
MKFVLRALDRDPPGRPMGREETGLVFLLRVSLSIVIAFLLTRFFFGRTPPIKVFALAGLMLGLAYLFEYMRMRKTGGRE